jgi:dTDP-4-dehydrorhamnose reductase
VIAVPRGDADITRRDAVLAAVRDSRCDLVVNAAAFTAVDKAEEEPEAAFAVNRDGPAMLAEICAARGLPLIHISTDYVFDGRKTSAYDEEDEVNPLGVYGKSKEAGESAIRGALAEHLILRTAWVFSAHRQNFVKTMLRLAESRSELRVVADQFGCPTPAHPFAEAVLKIAWSIGNGDWGTYHLCGAERTSWHGFAQAIFEQRARMTGQPAPLLHPIATSEFPTPAERPANSELDCTKLEARLGIPPLDWRSGLAQVLGELIEQRDE